MQLSVVIPSKNGLHHLKECLPTVIAAAQHFGPNQIEIIVVDDNSTDNTLQQVTSLFPQVRILQNPRAGICSARNTGVQHSAGDWLFFLDNDVFVEKDFFTKVAAYLQPSVFAVTCCGYWAGDPSRQLDGIKLFRWKRGFPRVSDNIYNAVLQKGKVYPSFGAQGAYFACKRSCFEQLGGFDEIYDPCVLEETDLIYRGLKRGWKVVYAPNTHPLHKCGGTIQSKTSKRTQFLSRRNRVFFVWKNITSKRLLFYHFCRLVTSPSPRIIYQVLRKWPIIRKKRAQEKPYIRVSDEQLLKQSADLERELRPNGHKN